MLEDKIYKKFSIFNELKEERTRLIDKKTKLQLRINNSTTKLQRDELGDEMVKLNHQIGKINVQINDKCSSIYEVYFRIMMISISKESKELLDKEVERIISNEIRTQDFKSLDLKSIDYVNFKKDDDKKISEIENKIIEIKKNSLKERKECLELISLINSTLDPQDIKRIDKVKQFLANKAK